jgi:hypothetical protein
MRPEQGLGLNSSKAWVCVAQGQFFHTEAQCSLGPAVVQEQRHWHQAGGELMRIGLRRPSLPSLTLQEHRVCKPLPKAWLIVGAPSALARRAGRAIPPQFPHFPPLPPHLQLNLMSVIPALQRLKQED